MKATNAVIPKINIVINAPQYVLCFFDLSKRSSTLRPKISTFLSKPSAFISPEGAVTQ